jgi:hypothetical protein
VLQERRAKGEKTSNLFEKEDMLWLTDHALKNRMTVSEVIGKCVRLCRTLQELGLYAPN